jgi:hypothetical protein
MGLPASAEFGFFYVCQGRSVFRRFKASGRNADTGSA